jgi:hypothetical protein
MPEKMGHCQVGAHSDISPSYSSSWLGFSLAIRVCSDRILPMRHIDIVEKAVQPLSESKTGFSYHVTHSGSMRVAANDLPPHRSIVIPNAILALLEEKEARNAVAYTQDDFG